MLSPQLVKRIRTEVPVDGEFSNSSTEETFMKAANFLSKECEVDNDGVINFLKELYAAVCEEYSE